MKLAIIAVVITAFISCHTKEVKHEDKKPVVKDTSYHNIDTLYEFFSKRYFNSK